MMFKCYGEDGEITVTNDITEVYVRGPFKDSDEDSFTGKEMINFARFYHSVKTIINVTKVDYKIKEYLYIQFSNESEKSKNALIFKVEREENEYGYIYIFFTMSFDNLVLYQKGSKYKESDVKRFKLMDKMYDDLDIHPEILYKIFNDFKIICIDKLK